MGNSLHPAPEFRLMLLYNIKTQAVVPPDLQVTHCGPHECWVTVPALTKAPLLSRIMKTMKVSNQLCSTILKQALRSVHHCFPRPWEVSKARHGQRCTQAEGRSAGHGVRQGDPAWGCLDMGRGRLIPHVPKQRPQALPQFRLCAHGHMRVRVDRFRGCGLAQAL